MLRSLLNLYPNYLRMYLNVYTFEPVSTYFMFISLDLHFISKYVSISYVGADC
jgi:hypothetical protein